MTTGRINQVAVRTWRGCPVKLWRITGPDFQRYGNKLGSDNLAWDIGPGVNRQNFLSGLLFSGFCTENFTHGHRNQPSSKTFVGIGKSEDLQHTCSLTNLPSYKWGRSPDSRWRKICVFWHSWGVFFPWFYCFGDSVLLLDMKNPKYPTKIIFVDDFFGVLCFIHVFTSWKNTKGGGVSSEILSAITWRSLDLDWKLQKADICFVAQHTFRKICA